MSMADRVAVMNRGTIQQLAPPKELYERPRTAWVARFIGSPPMNLFQGTRRNGSIDLGEAGTVEIAGLVPDEGVAATGGEGGVTAAGSDETVAETGGDEAVVEAETRAEPGPGTEAGPRTESGPGTETGTEPSAGLQTDAGATGVVTTAERADVALGVRPEDLTLSTTRPSAENVIEGVVDTVEPLGEYDLVNVAVNDQLVNVKEPTATAGRGDAVYLTFDDGDAYLYDDAGELVS